MEEFENQLSAERQGLASVAKDLSESVTDPSIQETEVYSTNQSFAILIPSLNPSLLFVCAVYGFRQEIVEWGSND